jgi:DNA-directed RNA polymerase I, II, and III subunit RPABC1
MEQSYESILIRSRVTILQMLEDRGFDTTPYASLTGTDILKLMPNQTNPDGLIMEVKHRSNPERRAVVIYTDARIKQSVSSYIEKLVKSEESTPEIIKRTDYIIITMPQEPIVEIFDKAALEAYRKYGMRISFFNMARMVVNLMYHVAQPKFEYVPPEQHKDLLKEWHCLSKSQFHHIKFHSDPVARYMGLVVGDIVKITRPSLSAGEYVLYRTCVP